MRKNLFAKISGDFCVSNRLLRLLRGGICPQPCRVSLLFIVTHQEKPFSTVLLFISQLSAALGHIYAENFQPLPSSDNKMKTFNFFFVSFRCFYHRHVLTTFSRIMCVYLCLLREMENFYHTKPPREYCSLFTGGDFCVFSVHVSSHVSMKATLLDSVQIVPLIINDS